MTTYLITEAQIQQIQEIFSLGEGASLSDIQAADSMLQSLPMVDSEPATIDTEAVQVLARRTYRQHKNSIRGQQITEADSFENHLIWATAQLYTSPQPLQPITADDVTDEMVHQWKQSGAESYTPKDDMAAAYNAVIKHRSEEK